MTSPEANSTVEQTVATEDAPPDAPYDGQTTEQESAEPNIIRGLE